MAAPANTNTTTMLGLLGSDLNLWWMSGSFPYLNGFSGEAVGVLGSCSTDREKAGAL